MQEAREENASEKNAHFLYSAFGQTIQSEIKLPGFLNTENTAPDISIQISKSKTLPHNKLFHISVLNDQTTIEITWNGIARYQVKQGKHIDITPHRGALPEIYIQPLYGIVLAATLLQRNLLPLHANCIERNGEAIIILGEKGHGKSTLTAFLLLAGYNIISDDITIISNSPDQKNVYQGIPLLKLWPDTALAIKQNPRQLPHVNSFTSKRYWIPKNICSEKSYPLKQIIVLSSGSTLALTPIHNIDSLLCLLKNQYFAKYSHRFPVSQQKRLFKQCSSIASTTPIYKLTRPYDRSLLPDTVKLIESRLNNNLTD